MPRPNATSLAALALATLAAACGGCAPAATARHQAGAAYAPSRGAAARFAALTRAYLDARFRYNPSEATTTGVHAYDDRLEDLSRPAIERYARFLAATRADLEALIPELPARDPEAPAGGSDHPRLDAELLRDAIALEHTRLVEWRDLAHQPGLFHQLAAGAIYELMVRQFAPVDVRVRAATARLEAVPAMLRAGEAWLEAPPRLAVEVALREIEGSIGMVRDVFPAFADRAASANDRDAAHRAAAAAARALERHRDVLRDAVLPRATGDYHDGRARWTTRARLADAVTEPPEVIREAALAEVRRLQGEMRALAARLARPGEDLRAVLDRIMADHPPADRLLDAYRAQQDAVRAFVRARNLVAIDPARDDLAIAPTPPFLRATIFAALSSPGALEGIDRRTFFYVTPADPTRPQAEVDAYLTEHSAAAIAVTTIHEAYPGHHVQGIHQRNAPSLVRRILWHGTYGEGWAHYAEQMLVDEGFGDDAIRLDQRKEALLRAARAYLDVGVHVFGMSYEDALRFYRDEAFMAEPGAEMEARRVCLDPAAVYIYTYGKFALYRLRRAVVGAGRQSLGEFHNAVLDFGSAPLPRLARALYNVDLGPWTPGEVPLPSSSAER